MDGAFLASPLVAQACGKASPQLRSYSQLPSHTISDLEKYFFLVWCLGWQQISSSLDLHNCARNREIKPVTIKKSPLIKLHGAQSLRETFGNQKRETSFLTWMPCILFFIPEDGIDSRVWSPSEDGIFSMTSFFATPPSISLSSPVDTHWDFLWKTKAPPRILVFAWLALRGRILIIDNLSWRKMIIVNACPLFPKWVWRQLGSSSYHCWFGQHMDAHHRLSKRKDFVGFSFVATIWAMWKESKMLRRKGRLS